MFFLNLKKNVKYVFSNTARWLLTTFSSKTEPLLTHFQHLPVLYSYCTDSFAWLLRVNGYRLKPSVAVFVWQPVAYGITQCYLPPDTGECASPLTQPRWLVLIWLHRRDGSLNWMWWWLNTKTVYPWTVTRLRTNLAQRRVTSLMWPTMLLPGLCCLQ